MTLVRFVFIAFAFMLSIHLSAQYGLREGYYITLEGDTIYGFLEDKGDANNALNCSFKKDKSAGFEVFKPQQIRAYRFKDDKFFISKKVKVDNAELNIFAQYLVNGETDLYYYPEFNREHFFLEMPGDTLIALTNKEKVVTYIETTRDARGIENLKLVKSNRYLGILKFKLSNCPEVLPMIDKLKFTTRSLAELIKSYNDKVCPNGQCVLYQKEFPKNEFSFAPVFGVNFSKFGFKDDEVYSKFDFKSAMAFSGGLSIRNAMPRANNKYFIQLDLILSKGKNDAEFEESSSFRTTLRTLEIEYLQFFSSFGFGMKFGKKKLYPTASAGFMYCTFPSTTTKMVEVVKNQTFDQEFVYEDIPLTTTLWGFYAQAGLNYKAAWKHTVSLNLKYRMHQGKSSYLPTTFNSFDLNLAYYF